MTPALRQALEVAISKCTSCKTTGRPLKYKKISFDKLLRTFNDHVQVDFLFIRELGKEPDLAHKGQGNWILSEPLILSSRDMNEVATALSDCGLTLTVLPSRISRRGIRDRTIQGYAQESWNTIRRKACSTTQQDRDC